MAAPSPQAGQIPAGGYASAMDAMLAMLAEQGALPGLEWKAIVRQVPRHLFAPAIARACPGSPGAPQERLIDRDADPGGWLDAVYSDMTVITQRDDGAADPAGLGGIVTSSLSAPGIVMSFLGLLQLEPGQDVLEIGTGTGWTAALLAARCGDQHVTSIEVDPTLHASAAAHLRAAGRSPRLILGDGALGVPGEMFDRLHVTCGVRDIPLAWIAQLRPGGVAVLPWHPNGMDGWQVRLTVGGDGTATGTFCGMASYMMLRDQRLGRVLWRSHHGDQADVTTTALDPAEIADAGRAAALALIAANPGLTCIASRDSGGAAFVHVAETGNPEGSWAACDAGPRGKHVVTQYGPRRLWEETEAAFAQWDADGRPGPDQYRLIVTPSGQRVQLTR